MDRYAESTTLRPILIAAASVIPIVGPVATAADEMVMTRVAQAREQRLRCLMEDVRNGHVNLDGPIEWHEVDLVLHAAYITIEATVRTSRRQKIRAFAELFTSGLGDQPMISYENEYEDHLKIVDDLSLRELRLLYLLYSFEMQHSDSEVTLAKAITYWNEFTESASKELSIPSNELSGLLARLARTGTYEIYTGAYYDYAGGVGHLTGTFHRLSGLMEFSPHLFDSGEII